MCHQRPAGAELPQGRHSRGGGGLQGADAPTLPTSPAGRPAQQQGAGAARVLAAGGGPGGRGGLLGIGGSGTV